LDDGGGEGDDDFNGGIEFGGKSGGEGVAFGDHLIGIFVRFESDDEFRNREGFGSGGGGGGLLGGASDEEGERQKGE
jgi:hypothetical protein